MSQGKTTNEGDQGDYNEILDLSPGNSPDLNPEPHTTCCMSPSSDKPYSSLAISNNEQVRLSLVWWMRETSFMQGWVFPGTGLRQV